MFYFSKGTRYLCTTFGRQLRAVAPFVCEKLNVLKQYCTYENIVTRFHRRTLTGNLYIRAMGRHGFLVYFPRNTFWRFGMQLSLHIRPFAMAAEKKVASTLNRLAGRAFLDVLSPRDKSSMADLIADFSRRHKRTRTARKRSLVIELH